MSEQPIGALATLYSTMFDPSTTRPIPTGVLLGRYYGDLLGAGIPDELAKELVSIAARSSAFDAELLVSAVSA